MMDNKHEVQEDQQAVNDQPVMHRDLVVAVDIGTTKVVAIAGLRNEHGKLEVLAIAKETSEGVMRGVVTNIDKTVKAINDAVSRAEKQANQKFTSVHVGIAGKHIKTLQHRGMIVRDNEKVEIGQSDIQRMIDDIHKLVLPAGDKILHVIPQDYTVDKERGISDPIGMSGVNLEGNFYLVTGNISASNNIYRCLERCNLEVDDLTLEPIASSEAVLSMEEKQAGVALVDMGGGTTDITIFHEGIIRHTAVLPFGGNAITSDIRQGCNIMPNQAEKLKVNFGSALASEAVANRVIAIPGLKGQDSKEISDVNLAHIIQARVSEILDFVVWEIRRSGLGDKLLGGIVLTGGGSLLNHMDKLTQLHTGLNARIGSPVEHLAHGYGEKLASPIYATSIGLLIRAIDKRESDRFMQEFKIAANQHQKASKMIEKEDDTPTDEKGSWFDSIINTAKKWFEEAPDSNF